MKNNPPIVTKQPPPSEDNLVRISPHPDYVIGVIRDAKGTSFIELPAGAERLPYLEVWEVGDNVKAEWGDRIRVGTKLIVQPPMGIVPSDPRGWVHKLGIYGIIEDGDTTPNVIHYAPTLRSAEQPHTLTIVNTTGSSTN